MSESQFEGEVVAEEDAEAREATGPVRRLPVARQESSAPALRTDVKSAAIAAAGGVLAGAATVAAVRAVGAVSSRAARPRRLARRRGSRPQNVVASRSFIVDVHLLGR